MESCEAGGGVAAEFEGAAGAGVDGAGVGAGEDGLADDVGDDMKTISSFWTSLLRRGEEVLEAGELAYARSAVDVEVSSW